VVLNEGIERKEHRRVHDHADAFGLAVSGPLSFTRWKKITLVDTAPPSWKGKSRQVELAGARRGEREPRSGAR
jgi:hypothetical protein